MPLAADKILKNSLKKNDRLKSSIEIDALYRENKFVISYPLKCYYSFSEKTAHKNVVRVAFSVPKRIFKHAVERNKIKRRIREAYRLNYKKIFETFITQDDKQLKLFIIYIGKEVLDYTNIDTNLQSVLQKIAGISL
jgi:ribonuclease P protein component